MNEFVYFGCVMVEICIIIFCYNEVEWFDIDVVVDFFFCDMIMILCFVDDGSCD